MLEAEETSYICSPLCGIIHGLDHLQIYFLNGVYRWRKLPAYFLILHNGPFVSEGRRHVRSTLHLLNSLAISQVNGPRKLRCPVLGVIGSGWTMGGRHGSALR